MKIKVTYKDLNLDSCMATIVYTDHHLPIKNSEIIAGDWGALTTKVYARLVKVLWQVQRIYGSYYNQPKDMTIEL